MKNFLFHRLSKNWSVEASSDNHLLVLCHRPSGRHLARCFPDCSISKSETMIDESLNSFPRMRYRVLSTYEPLLFDVENKFCFFETSQGFSFLFLLKHIFLSAKSERLVVFVPLIRVFRNRFAVHLNRFSLLRLELQFSLTSLVSTLARRSQVGGEEVNFKPPTAAII